MQQRRVYPNTVDLDEKQNIGRIINRNRDKYQLVYNGNIFEAVITGKLFYNSLENSQLPVTGDWVLFEIKQNLAIVKQLLPRITVISRKVAGTTTEEQAISANIDIVGIVFSLDGGRNYNSRTLERYLTIAWNSGAKPLVILNKADLSDAPEAIKAEAKYVAPGAEVIITSAESGEGIDILRSNIPSGKTVVFIGPSGVGKSALTNALLGNNLQKTGAIRDADKRGRHTTTNSKMIKIPKAGMLIDSPGLREIQLWGDQEGLDSVFEEITEIASACKFRDCTHMGEPGCAVQQALAEGTLDANRYQSYLELKKELAYLESRQNGKARQERKTKSKKFGKFVKDMKNKKIIY